MIDLGLVDPLHQVGFEVAPSIYDRLKRAGQLAHFRWRFRRDASGRIERLESGMTVAQLVDPNTRKEVGPVVSLAIFRGTSGMPNRVGVVFFHNLTGCKVLWELGARNWCVEY
jgi:hypothetical protein